MRYIRNISDDQNKVGDTDNIFRFNLIQGDDIFNFGDYPISINIANSSGYILSMVPEKEFGNSVLKLDFNEQSLKSLTPDNYLLEVEVKLPDGTTATFPTKGGMPFSVNSNLKNTAGQLVPTVTFDEVLNAVDEKVNNYLATVVKGDKGDKGDTGAVNTTADYTWTGTNTFNKKIIAPAGVQGNSDTATKLQNARLVGGVAFDGTSDIALPGVNVKGNQDTSGRAANATNADLATKTVALQTPRKINGTNFDGTLDINVNAANDGSLVHNTGTETVAGDKTFTGKNTFTGQTSFWFKQIQWTSDIMQGTWYIQRIGNWVNAKFDMSANTATGTTTLTLPVGYRPISVFTRELEQGVSGIKRDGTIYIVTSYTGSNAMTFSYPTNDVWPTA